MINPNLSAPVTAAFLSFVLTPKFAALLGDIRYADEFMVWFDQQTDASLDAVRYGTADGLEMVEEDNWEIRIALLYQMGITPTFFHEMEGHVSYYIQSTPVRIPQRYPRRPRADLTDAEIEDRIERMKEDAGYYG